MRFWTESAAAVLVAVLLCCGGAPEGEKAEDAGAQTDVAPGEAIAAAGADLLDAYLSRDLDRWLAGFTRDVVVMPPGAGMVAGIEDLAEASRIQFGLLEGYEVEVESDVLETVVAGDWAFTRDLYVLRYLPVNGGDPIVDRGRSLTIWQRQPDGRWLVSRHMLNRPTKEPG